MEKHGTSNTLSRDNSAQCGFLFYFVTDIKKNIKSQLRWLQQMHLGTDQWNKMIVLFHDIEGNQTINATIDINYEAMVVLVAQYIMMQFTLLLYEIFNI